MSLPFRRILCPIDFGDNSLEALDTAATVIRENDGMLFVLHVVPMVLPPAGMPSYVNIYTDEEERAKHRLKEIAYKRLAGLKYELLTRLGDPARGIVDCANTTGADLLVMGTHGRRRLSRVLLGSVAEFVVRKAGCPVLVIRHPNEQKNSIDHAATPNRAADDK